VRGDELVQARTRGGRSREAAQCPLRPCLLVNLCKALGLVRRLGAEKAKETCT
jgi:hypothetical protein